MSTPQPGWYPEPHDPRRVRGRDGVRWSSHVGPAPHGDPSPGASGGHNGAAVDPTRPHAASAKLSAEYDELRERVVELREIAMLQEVGVYRYAHSLASATAYKLRLQTIERHIHGAIKRGDAAVGALTWSVNGCTKEGARRVADLSRLMLRADSNEADGAVRAMKPYALDAAKRRLEQSRATLSKLGKRMQIHTRRPLSIPGGIWLSLTFRA